MCDGMIMTSLLILTLDLKIEKRTQTEKEKRRLNKKARIQALYMYVT